MVDQSNGLFPATHGVCQFQQLWHVKRTKFIMKLNLPVNRFLGRYVRALFSACSRGLFYLLRLIILVLKIHQLVRSKFLLTV